MERKTFVLFIVLAIATVSSAFAGKVSIATSQYGDPTGHDPMNCVAPECILPTGVTMTEQDFSFNVAPGEVFYFQVTSDVSNFTLTLLGAQNFLADDTNDPPQFFGFGAFCPGGDLPPCNQTNMTPGFSDGTTNSVSFSVPGNGNGLSFFVVEPAATNSTQFVNDIRALDAVSGVTATLTLNSSSVPEPSSLALIALLAASFLLLRRFRAARQN